MKKQDEAKSRLENMSKAKQQFRNSKGEILPSVTGVIGAVEDKSGLIKWANKIGLSGVDYDSYMTNASGLGKCIHERVRAHLENAQPDLKDFDLQIIDMSEIAYQGFIKWQKINLDEVVATEVQLICEEYSGRFDLLCYTRDRKRTLLDIKSGGIISKTVKCQLEAYAHVWDAQHPDQPIEQIACLQLNKQEIDYEYKCADRSEIAWQTFCAALKVKQLLSEKW